MNYQNQLTLLSDILKNQQAQKHGTEDEFSQIHRLTEILQTNGQIDENMQEMLSNIANYCLNKGDTGNSAHIEHWTQSIDELTMPFPHE